MMGFWYIAVSGGRGMVVPWPFADPPNLAVMTTHRVLAGQPILLIQHDADDGGWQFLDGGPASLEDARVVSLGNIVQIDASVVRFAALPLGWRAWRATPNERWQTEPI